MHKTKIYHKEILKYKKVNYLAQFYLINYLAELYLLLKEVEIIKDDF